VKLSRSTQYAIVALSKLSHDPQSPPLSCHDICADAGMPERFVLQVMRSLVNAGLVKATRGCEGGYRLAKSPTAISTLDIIEAVEGPIAPEKPWVTGSMGGRIGKLMTLVIDDTRYHLRKQTLAALVK
jgi:Rrf2 family protein